MPAQFRSSSLGAGFGPTTEVDRPPRVQTGDTLYAAHLSSTPFTGIPGPTGWASAGPSIADGDGLYVRLWKRAASSGTSRYVFPQADDGLVVIVAASGASATVSARVAISGPSSAGGTISTPTVEPAAASTLELRFGLAVSDLAEFIENTYAPTGYVLREAIDAEGALFAALASKQISSSSPSGSKVFSVSPPAVLFSYGITISVPSADTEPPPEPLPPFTPGSGSALYRYDFRRLRDNAYLGTLDLEGVTFDKRILQPGTFSATIPIPSREVGDQVAAIIPRDETVLNRGPGVITCQIFREGEPWGEYWITAASISRNGRETPSITLRGSTLDAYFLNVELQEGLSFTGDDQIDIARTLLENMQGQQYADLGILLQGGTSGTNRDRTYAADEATYGQRLTELAQVEDGFEWMINIVAGAFQLERHWVWGEPLGQQSPAPHVFSDGPYGGDVLSWQEDIDALRGATRWRARGDRVSTDASITSTPLISAAAEATAHLEWWPRIDKTITRSSVTEMSTLDSYAAYWAATAAGALRVDSLTVALGAEPTFTPNSLGDTARIHLNNEWHLPHWRTRRIIGIGVTPTSKSSGKEVARLIVEGQETP